ncbi:MAG: transcriptional regulator [Euryarchaeota archaeon]|nr:transcriptional regulator [Euryarchaeota archaeon]
MRDTILKILKKAGRRGILQESFTREHGISKSTVSTVLSALEEESLVVRKRVAGRSYMVWHVDFAPGPVRGMVRVGILKAIEYPGVLLAASDMKNVKLKVYTNAFKLTRDLAEGYIDVGCSPLITQTLFALVHRSIHINGGCGFNGGGVVFRKGKPERFGSTELSTMEFSLRRFMELRGMDGEILYFSRVEEMKRAIEAGTVDAVAIWEPYLTELSEKYSVVRFEEVFGEYPCCTIASSVKSERRKEHREFLEAYRRAVDSIDSRVDEVIALESKLLRLSRRAIRRAFHGYKYSWHLDRELAMKTLEDYGIKLTEESVSKVFNLF